LTGRRLSHLDWNKISWIIAIQVVLALVALSFVALGGDDLCRYYIPFADGCLDCGFVPYFARWILWPLTFVPRNVVWPVWTAVTVAGFLILCRYTKVNPLVVILSWPFLGQWWLGQIDVIVAAGLVIGVLALNPYLRGLGILLALVKPQLTGLAVLVLLLHQPRRDVIKALAMPLAAVALSFLVYGFTWPIDWLSNSLNSLPPHVWRMASVDVWPYGILFVLTLFGFKSFRSRFETALVVSVLATPFFGVYSYVIFLVFRAPWWSLPLSYVWLLLHPMMGRSAMRFAWVLPVALLGLYYFERLREKRAIRID
jgi:hypothetical protein